MITRLGTYPQIKGISYKTPCVVATTGAITLTGTQTIDGIAVVAGDRILVKDQGTASANGIYIVAAGAWSRAVDMSVSDDAYTGLQIYINSGTANNGRTFYLTTANPITLGTTGLTFSGSSIYDSKNSTGPALYTYFNSVSVGDLASTYTNYTFNVTSSGSPIVTMYTGSSNTAARNWAIKTNDTVFGDFSIYQSNALGGDPISAGTKRFYLNAAGDATFSSSVTATSFSGAGTGLTGTASSLSIGGNAATATKVSVTVTGTNVADVMYAAIADNDYARIRVGGTATNAGYLEFATADDGTEPIYVRQYTGVFTTLTRTATLLDGSGNTSFPGSVTASSFSGTIAGSNVSGNISGNASNITSYTVNQSVGTGNSVTFAGILSNGAINATGDITAYYSDGRLKDNLQPISNAISKVMSLTGYTYNTNALGLELLNIDNNEKQVGLIAQELQKVQPEAVKLAPFDRDENGMSKSGENYLTIQYGKVVPLLVEAIKEQQKQIDELKSVINELTK